MRVLSDTRLLEVQPGDTTSVVVDVTNTAEVIDGVSARVIGLADECVNARPALLPLFPDSSGQLTVDLSVPTALPAGRHPLTVEIVSHGAGAATQFLDVDLDVAARPKLSLTARPRVARARRSARFVLELVNGGNTPLDVALSSVDSDRQAQVHFVPERLRIEPGASSPVIAAVRGPRMFTGPEVDRIVSVEAQARQVPLGAPVAPPGPPTRPDPDGDLLPALHADEPAEPVAPVEAARVDLDATLSRQTTLTMHQKPMVGRGVLTALILVGIVALWAGAFLLGLGKVFGQDPMTKDVPASFYAADTVTSGDGQAPAGYVVNKGGDAPAGALAKNGQVPAGTGGTITGTVIARSDQAPIGRILVRAYRVLPNGSKKAVSSAATQSDGTYTLAGLFPTTYHLEFSADGYQTQWYPASPSIKGSQAISVASQQTKSLPDATVVGLPASISGSVDDGDASAPPVTTTVTARALTADGTPTGKDVGKAKTDGSGKYVLHHLDAPNSYQLTFTTPGYEPSTVTVDVNGGDARLQPTVVLGAATTSITGLVHEGATPLGGVKITTTSAGAPVSVVTPTTGQIGSFTLTDLPTPATYVLRFSADGYGSTTRIVDLEAGAKAKTLDVDLASGIGVVTGRVYAPGKQPLGGVTVSVGGSASVGGNGSGASTTTLTGDGTQGEFTVSGLHAPGSYTLTFSHDGYLSQTLSVTLPRSGAPQPLTVRMAAATGTIDGEVDLDGKGFGGATVTAADGTQAWTTTSSTTTGSFQIADLQPGVYTLTVTADTYETTTALVTVTAGTSHSQQFTLRTAH